MTDYGRGDVIGQIRYDLVRGRTASAVLREQGAGGHGEHVSFYDAYIQDILQCFLEQLHHPPVYLDRDDLGNERLEDAGEEACAGAYFDHGVVSREIGGGGDRLMDAGVDKKVLAESFVGTQTMAFEKLFYPRDCRCTWHRLERP